MLSKERADKIQTMIDDCIFGNGEADIMFDYWGVTEEEYTEFMDYVFRYIELSK